MSTYFYVIFDVYHTALRYDVCPDEYMDLLPRSISGTTLEDTKLVRRIKRRGS